MKIQDMQTTVIAVPNRKPHPTSWLKWNAPGSQPAIVVVVELLTDEEINGFGEATVWISAETTLAYLKFIKPVLIGQDPFQVNVLRKNLHAYVKGVHLRDTSHGALAAVEMAMWDLLGKSVNKPLYKIWGGAFRKEIPYFLYVARARPEEMAAEAERLIRENGSGTLFTKVGFGIVEDEEALRGIREGAARAGNADALIRIDANQTWTPGAAVRNIKRLERYGLEYVEQPTTMHNLDGMARIRKSVDTPILAHESCWTFYDTLNVIKREAADAIQIDPRFDVGYAGAKIAAGMAEAAGMPVSVHIHGELGLATSSIMHLVASGPNFSLANQTEYRNRTDDIMKGDMFRFERGHLRLPEGPGLGVEIDRAKLKKYADYYANEARKSYESDSAPFKDEFQGSVNIPGTQP